MTGINAKRQRGIDTILISVDFTDLLPKKCELSKSGGGDFVSWTPADPHGDKCFLGAEVQLYRKKPDNQCYIGREFEPLPVDTKPCDCKEEDFEW
jgi:hypothetical protein